jgi:hypothetical protein
MEEWDYFDLVNVSKDELTREVRSLTSSEPTAPLKILPDEKVICETIVLT